MKTILFLTISLLSTLGLYAQPASLDASFDPNGGFNNPIYSLVIQPDNKIIVGGAFTNYNGIITSRLARLNNDGSLDGNFNVFSGFNETVNCVVLQNDGKILVGGDFSMFTGNFRNKIARLNSDGSIDLTFNPGSGFDMTVSKMVLQPDGKIIVGGVFTSYNGLSRNRIIRLNNDGSIDLTFNIGTGFNNVVHSICLQSDGKIIVGGEFTIYNGVTTWFLTRLNADGSIDSTFNSGLNQRVYCIDLQSDGKIIVGGSFSFSSGISANRLARLNINGSADATFDIGNGFNHEVKALKVDVNNKIVVGGSFSSFNGLSRNMIARLNSNGNLDVAFDPITGFNNWVYAIDLQTDGKIITGGGFTLYNGLTRKCIARLMNCSTSSSIAQIEVCSSYSWIDGITYTSSTNAPTFVLPNSVGCDSIVNLHLTINQPSLVTRYETACGSFMLNNQTYTQSGTYVQQLMNVAGCDSTIILHLTINQPSLVTLNETACGSFTLNNLTYTQSGTYAEQLMNVAGCDSTITLYLTINQPSLVTLNETACDSFTLNNQTYTQSGTYTQELMNLEGCDSSITLHLTINQPSLVTLNETACDSFTLNNQTYTQSGTYAQQLSNVVGCDSTIILNLTIPLINNTITQNQSTLTSVASTGTYQWIDCGTMTAMAGETSPSFTATQDGSYAVIVSDNGCSDTSECIEVDVLGMQQYDEFTNLRIYPNPSSGYFIGEFSVPVIEQTEIFVLDQTGRIVTNQVIPPQSEIFVLNLQSLQSGVYTLRLNSPIGSCIKRLILEQ